MKLKLLSIVLFFLFTSAVFSHSLRTTLSVARKDSSSVYLVSYSDRNPGKVSFTVKDYRGYILFKRFVQNETGFVMPINLSSVGEGVYTVEINNGREKQNITIDYDNTAPTYTRIINLGENRYFFTTTHTGKETIAIKIYDEKDALIFDENRTIEGYYSTIFCLKDVTGEPPLMCQIHPVIP